MADGAYLYILECSDGSYYTGTTRNSLEHRLSEHNSSHFSGYTATKRPVTLVYSQWFDRITDAIEAERKVKGWSRAKKQALIQGDFAGLRALSARHQPFNKKPKNTMASSFETPLSAAPQDEE
ncbi:MAG TPA: GIY-YIG nuclease family protein [Xanthobacteraceae bacterium]|jgi:putative endonuclease|nr:GIY-YIG nuclease family protein [Xanthobacteraceae bacterium]